jgi:hypothetical protein
VVVAAVEAAGEVAVVQRRPEATVVVAAQEAAGEVAWPTWAATQVVVVVVLVGLVGAENRPGEVVPVPTVRHSSGVELDHSGTLPCLRRGSSSRLVANIRSPATSFWRVSAGSITSSM